MPYFKPFGVRNRLRYGLLVWTACSVSQTGQAETRPDLMAAHAGHATTKAAAPQALSDIESSRIRTGLPFANPPIISSKRGVLEMKMTPRAVPVSISGKRVNARVFSMSAQGKSYPPAFMPPVLQLDSGDKLKVTLVNKLGEPTNLHTHGFFISPMGNQDNIFVDLPAGKTFLYNYDLPEKYSRVLQICSPNLDPVFVQLVDSIEALSSPTERGEGGFGSTGTGAVADAVAVAENA